jgi:hypothetical protein
LAAFSRPVGALMEELIAKRFGERIYIYGGFNACPLRSFRYWEWLQLFGIPIKDSTKKKIKVEGWNTHLTNKIFLFVYENVTH